MPDRPNILSRSGIGRPLGVFRHRPFLIFWIGACISNTGNWTENAAQSWAVTSQTIGNLHQGFLVENLQFADFCPVLLLALLVIWLMWSRSSMTAAVALSHAKHDTARWLESVGSSNGFYKSSRHVGFAPRAGRRQRAYRPGHTGARPAFPGRGAHHRKRPRCI